MIRSDQQTISFLAWIITCGRRISHTLTRPGPILCRSLREILLECQPRSRKKSSTRTLVSCIGLRFNALPPWGKGKEPFPHKEGRYGHPAFRNPAIRSAVEIISSRWWRNDPIADVSEGHGRWSRSSPCADL